MTREQHAARVAKLRAGLKVYESKRALPGIRKPSARATFIEQLIESMRRVEYVVVTRDSSIGDFRKDPTQQGFDPIKAAILHNRADELDEALWLVFLSVHFGRRSGVDGWRLCRDVYAGATQGTPWNWKRVSKNVDAFKSALDQRVKKWSSESTNRRFGNHRKYQSLNAYTENGTGHAVASYVAWVGKHRTHEGLIADAQSKVGDDPKILFHALYSSMGAVASFGRTARFDYLTMAGNLKLANIEPLSTYLASATGPKTGARRLFGTDPQGKSFSSSTMEAWLGELGTELGVGMQVLEDALCNWQKNPDSFTAFRG